MAELRIQLSGEDVRKLLSRQDTKISISHIVFAVGKEFIRDVETIVVTLSPDVSASILKHYIEEAEKTNEEKPS